MNNRTEPLIRNTAPVVQVVVNRLLIHAIDIGHHATARRNRVKKRTRHSSYDLPEPMPPQYALIAIVRPRHRIRPEIPHERHTGI